MPSKLKLMYETYDMIIQSIINAMYHCIIFISEFILSRTLEVWYLTDSDILCISFHNNWPFNLRYWSYSVSFVVAFSDLSTSSICHPFLVAHPHQLSTVLPFSMHHHFLVISYIMNHGCFKCHLFSMHYES